MKALIGSARHHDSILVGCLTLIIAFSLALATWDINFWPTDSYKPYIPTAAQLSQLRYLSEMHDLANDGLDKLNMRAKEAHILGIALMQKILGDRVSLYPNILYLILVNGLSTFLVFAITKKLFDTTTAYISFLLYSTCFWPYLYILQGSHQPLVLCNCLLTIYFILQSKKAGPREKLSKMASIFIAGATSGFMLFSSPTALIYTPYILGILFMKTDLTALPGKTLCPARMARNGLIFLCGLLPVILLFTYPLTGENIKQFLIFLLTSQQANHFSYYHEHLSTLFHLPPPFRGAGWVWILKYVYLVMPVMFSAYLLCMAYLLAASFRQRFILMIILISLSTPLAVETAQVAQFGRNYFSWLPGIIFLISYAIFHFKNQHNQRYMKPGGWLLFVFLSGHIILNSYVFFIDIFPARMATSDLARWLRQHQVRELLVYQEHPRNRFTADVINNPKIPPKIKLIGIESIRQPAAGYILIPPIAGKTIWNNCTDQDFLKDPDLTAIYDTGSFSLFNLKAFPTLAASKIWRQEEEICTYRDLIRGDIKHENSKTGWMYILDGKKLNDYWKKE